MTEPPAQPVRITIRQWAIPHAALDVRNLTIDPASTLRELLALLALSLLYPRIANWTFRIGDRELALSDRIGDLCQAHRGSAYRDGVLSLDLFYTDSSTSGAPTPASAPPAEAPAWGGGGDFEPALPEAREEEEEAEVKEDRSFGVPAPAAGPPPSDEAQRRERAEVRKSPAGGYAGDEKPQTERRATVRYYTRMNPDRMFPLLVILSAKQIEEVKKAVKQAVSASFAVAEGSTVEIEPVLPGCDCYPPRHTLAVEAKDAVTETFWVVPRVLGRVHGARVLVRQGDRVLAEVPLDVKVSRQTLAVVCALASLAAPYLTMGLKSLNLDYESQKADGFPLYQQVGTWIAVNLRPEWLGLGFLGLAFLLYLWMRPRRRDVFWDVNVKS
jgi:hypothetical protein